MNQKSFLRKVPQLVSKALTADSMIEGRIVEVGPSDGLQNEKQIVPTARRLTAAGLRDSEATRWMSSRKSGL